jgi:hemerythrin
MRLLAELRDYTELHFSEEEALMERIHYPELPSQKRAHAAFVDRLVNIDLDEMEDLDDNQQVYLLDLIQFLLNWLANHILACDKKIGEYMRENHISE